MMTESTIEKEGVLAPVVIASGDRTVTVQMRWGLKPLSPADRAYTRIRSDGREFPAKERCLVPANELPLTGPDGRKWIATLDEGSAFFCFAGIWRAATGIEAPTYAILTVPAYPDLAAIMDRHLAFVPKDLWPDWLGGAPTADILKPLPNGSLRVREAGREAAAGDLFQAQG